MNFEQAIEALKQGKRVARTGWNGEDMYLYLVKALVVGLFASPTDMLSDDWVIVE